MMSTIPNPLDAADLDAISDWLPQLGVMAASIGAGVVLAIVVVFVLRRVARRSQNRWDDKALRLLRGPLVIILPAILFRAALPTIDLDDAVRDILRHAAAVALMAGLTWAMIRAVRIGELVVLSKYDVSVSDNLQARRIHTQTRVLSRTLMTVVGIIGVAAILMTFPRVRQFGASILASAGLAGLVVGLAARPAVANLIAGLQIAITQPIRLDDVVIVEGEWGRVEEISSTFVVVKIWDERRLIVPLSYFIENPIQNWTRTNADLLGTVFLYLDYRVPLEPIREELKRLCEASDKWDKRVCLIQITDANDRTMQVRALVSASNSGNLWDLRCMVREKLIEFVQREYPEALPRFRAELEGPRNDTHEPIRLLSAPDGGGADHA